MRLLLLEDDLILGEGLRDFLRAEGHVVDWFTRLEPARQAIADVYDALLIDWQLPDGSGMVWIRALRREQNLTPILILTARDLLSDRIAGLDDGADDYLVKPFEPEELIARLRAVSRRAAGAASRVVTLRNLEVDLKGKTALLDARHIELTGKEWKLLEALLLRRGRIVPKADLENILVGQESEVSSNALEVHVSSLRRKLGRDLIQTVRGMGYRVPL